MQSNINSGRGTITYSSRTTTYSTGAYHDRTGGRYGSTGSRHQYSDVGAQTPAMQAASIQEAYGNRYFRQQSREDVVPKAERSRKTQQGDNRHLGGGHRSHSSSSASLASSGGENRKPKSRSRSSGGYTNVRTKDGQVATYLQKPPMPLNPKEKPRVIIKRSDGDFETGTLMYIGMINQKEMAGIQLDIRMPSKCSRCLLM